MCLHVCLCFLMCVGLKLASLYEAGLTYFESQGCISSFCELIFREKRGKLIIGVFLRPFLCKWKVLHADL